MPFSYEGAQVRVALIDDEPWWVARDLLSILGLANVTEALRGLEQDEFRDHEVSETTENHWRRARMVSESGLYALIFKSRTPAAKRFRRWVTTEVLPEIRRTGAYRSARSAGVVEQPTPRSGSLASRIYAIKAAERSGYLSHAVARSAALQLLDMGEQIDGGLAVASPEERGEMLLAEVLDVVRQSPGITSNGVCGSLPHSRVTVLRTLRQAVEQGAVRVEEASRRRRLHFVAGGDAERSHDIDLPGNRQSAAIS